MCVYKCTKSTERLTSKFSLSVPDRRTNRYIVAFATAFTALPITDQNLVKQLVDHICDETNPVIPNYRTSVVDSDVDPGYEVVQVCMVRLI